MDEQDSQVVKTLIKICVFLIGFFSVWGIMHTDGWTFLDYPRGVVVFLVAVGCMVWSAKGGIKLRGIKGRTVSTFALISMYVIFFVSILKPELAGYSPWLLIGALIVLILSMLAWE